MQVLFVDRGLLYYFTDLHSFKLCSGKQSVGINVLGCCCFVVVVFIVVVYLTVENEN